MATKSGDTNTPIQSEELAKRYQEEMDHALKRYNKAISLMTNPPEIKTGQTPREVIWTRNKAKVYHYLPTQQPKNHYPVPIFFIYALINRPYVVDLRPGASLMEFLVNQGYDVYLIDWGDPGLEDKDLTLDDYIMDYLPRAAKHVLRHSGAKELTIYGYCIGAALTAMFAAMFTPEIPFRNMVVMAAPIDFSEKGLFNEWLDPKIFNVNQIIEAYGNMPSSMIDFGSRLLKPIPNFVSTYTGAFDRLWDDRAIESWLSMQKWVNDGTDFPGAAFKQWVTEFYQQNKLSKGEFKLRGKPCLLSNIKANLFNIIAAQDHISLPSQSKVLMDLVSSTDKEEIILPAGHVGLVVGRSASKGLWPALDKWLAPRSV